MATLINVNVVKANAKLRRFILGFLLGLTGFAWLGIHWSHQLHNASPAHQVLNLVGAGLFLIASTIALGLFAFGAWMGRIGIASLQEGCYPPSNSIVLCDTLLVTGWQATTKALAALMLAIASLLGTIGLSLEIVELINL